MGDHFVLLVDRLITESTLEAAIESRSRMVQGNTLINDHECSRNLEKSAFQRGYGNVSLVECKICHDEDLDSEMETPCSCSGSLKYAHRRCVQRWCNEKGDTICEICHQQFKPDYTAPPPLLQLGRVPLNFRGNWGISRRELTDRRLIAVVPADHSFLGRGYDDEYPVSSTRSFLCCRSLILIFMVLLILRHTLPFMLTESNFNVFPLLTLLLVRVVGVVIPIFFVTKAISVCHRRHNEQLEESDDSSDEETERSDTHSSRQQLQTQSYIIRVR